MTPPLPPGEIAPLMRFIAEKVRNVKSPMNVVGLAAEFKEKSGSLMVSSGLRARIEKLRHRIYKMDNIDMDTKVKMMFALSASIDKGFLKKLKKQSEVEVDEKGRITKYHSKDGRLKLEGSHGKSYIKKSIHLNALQKACQKANGDGTEEEDTEEANKQKDYENKRVDLVRFLIERTKNATAPWSLEQLSKVYKGEFKCSESQKSIRHRITRFRRHIHKMNQFDMPTKVKMLFALSASIDAEFLKELQKDAVVELDGNQKIKKYKAKDGSLKVEGDHSGGAKRRATWANKKKKKMSVVKQSDSEEDEGDKDSSETDGSDEEDDEGNVDGSLNSNQPSTSLPKRRSERIKRSKVSTQNHVKGSVTAQSKSVMSRKRKRARIAHTSSVASEDDEESMTLENDPSMNSNTNNIDHDGDDFDYGPPVNNDYDENLEHSVTDPISERNIATPEVTDNMEVEEKREEEPSASFSAKIESMSLLELLNHLRFSIAQYTPTLASRIDENIEKLEKKDKQIPFNIIIESLESCIQILNTPDEMDPDENTTSLPDFYYHLGMAMCNISHSSMDDFHVKMRKLATTGDEKVSMEHIRYAMEETLDKILN